MKEITRKKFIGGPSPKSVKRVCREVHELTHSRNVLLPVETVVERVNRLLKGWGKVRNAETELTGKIIV